MLLVLVLCDPLTFIADTVNHSSCSEYRRPRPRSFRAAGIRMPSVSRLHTTCLFYPQHRREDRMRRIRNALSSRLAENAQYEDQKKTKCDEVTRGYILTEIDQWVRTPSDTEHCWWITGKPAVGKSAIGITAVQCLKDRQPIQTMRGDGHDAESEDGEETESEDGRSGSGRITGQSASKWPLLSISRWLSLFS